MEDSRNIIKAIDALTLKAGGEVVDSKNITEAIDNLRAVYNESAIGIDETLTQEGLAADAKAVGDNIQNLNAFVKTYNYMLQNTNFLNWITNTFKNNGAYYVIKSTLNNEGWPYIGIGGTGIAIIMKRNADYHVIAISNDDANTSLSYDMQTIYLNRYINNKWIGWSRLPDRREIEDIKSRLSALEGN